jgi:methionyl-tRNA synthetase
MTTQPSNEQHPPWYVTTAIPYVNARPHIGFALEIVLTDALARYHRLKGERVWFLTGADENSLKNVRAAEREGIQTQALVDRNAAQFEADRRLVNIAESLRERVDTAMAQFAPHEALAAIWELVGAANKYIAETEPWTLAKQRRAGLAGAPAEEHLATVLYNLVEILRLVAYYCLPFIPATAEAIASQLRITLEADSNWALRSRWGRYPPATMVLPGDVLFPKLETAVHEASA